MICYVREPTVEPFSFYPDVDTYLLDESSRCGVDGRFSETPLLGDLARGRPPLVPAEAFPGSYHDAAWVDRLSGRGCQWLWDDPSGNHHL